jgi:tRNA-Thr(GGU) m(6)t(6)A37 methyltransferase TsaA
MELTPIGYVVREASGEALSIPELQAQLTQIVIEPRFADGLLGVEPGCDLVVLYFIDRARNDVLQVHPRGDLARPLRGVFATRSPSRPNRIGVTTVRVLKVTGTVLDVVGLDALDGSPVLDLKSRSGTFDLPYGSQDGDG